MFEGMQHQHIADFMNATISREENPELRRSGIYALKRFEAAPYRARVLELAVAEAPKGSIQFDKTTGVDAKLEDLREILERYIDIYEEETRTPAIENELFTGRHAAWYVSRQLNRRGVKITPHAIDKHIRVTKDLRGQMLGPTMLFTRQQLDEYVSNYDKLPKRGRPAKEAVEN